MEYRVQSFLGCSLCLTVPDKDKKSRTIDEFKNVIKHWKGQEHYPCRICRQYVAQIGFLT